MAIVHFDRDSTRLDDGASEARFRPIQEICRSGDFGYWRALDGRSGNSCVVRVFETGGADTARRLGELHRERLLAERLARPDVLRTDVPLIEDERIFQLVDSEPVRMIDAAARVDSSCRLRIITQLANIARVLADAHARGVFHGDFSRASCLYTADDRLLIQGFRGDAAGAAAIRDGVAADHRAFLAFAQDMLQRSGGPPPRLRRYFLRALAADAPRPATDAMATLADELRESLEDTFPWPAGSSLSSTDTTGTATAPTDATVEMKVVSLSLSRSEPANPRPVPPMAQPVMTDAAAAPIGLPPPVVATDVAPAAEQVQACEEVAAVPVPATERARSTPKAAAVDVWYPPTVPERASAVADDEPPAAMHSSSRWLWVAMLAAAAAIWALWHLGTRSAAPPVTPASAASRAERGAAVTTTAALARSRTAADDAAALLGMAFAADATTPLAAGIAAEQAQPEAEPEEPSAEEPSAEEQAALALRTRVANLVAGGNRALIALEPSAAREAFAAALALAPNNRAAIEGSQRARRLAGVEALIHDARAAGARDDHARAVQGYAQALRADPRNRGLSEALAAVRRNLARDNVGVALAEGHAALGAGRLEAARDAFARALQLDPAAPGARHGAEQAAAAILLRDQSNARRLEPARANR
ncbi:MAG: hypothetical protein H7A18_09080 [Sinobacteraceae bacterium]|nr:hypothetical protein [Nevskiaceae bacterium]MCP5472214.1 hypothetical protein [Nevskiaceae bacterium]